MLESHIDLKVGWNCNHNCVHCVVSDKKQYTHRPDFSLDELKNIIDKYSTCDKFTITGGEPTIRPDLVDMVQYIKKINPSCTIDLQTNGTGLKDINLTKELVKYVDSFLVAIHSFDKVEHDFICQKEGSWDDTLNGLSNLINLKSDKFKIQTQTVISKYNLLSLEKTFDFFHMLNVDNSSLTFPHAMGNALADFYNVVPKYSDLKDIVHNILSKYYYKIYTSAFPPCYLQGFKHQIEGSLEEYQSYSSYDRCIELVNDNPGYEPDGDFKEMVKYDFKKPQECLRCVYNNKCLGVWKEYVDLYQNELDIYPIEYKKDILDLLKYSKENNKLVSPIILNNEILFDCDIQSYSARKLLLKQLDIKSGSKILDICCNNGTNSFILEEVFPNILIHGFDIDETSIKIANILKTFNGSKINFTINDEDCIIDHHKFDYILNAGIDNTLDEFDFRYKLYKQNKFSGKIILIYNVFNNGVIFDKNFIEDRLIKTKEKYNIENIFNVGEFSALVICGEKT